MVKRNIDREIMESINKYIEKISKYYKIEAIILFHMQRERKMKIVI